MTARCHEYSISALCSLVVLSAQTRASVRVLELQAAREATVLRDGLSMGETTQTPFHPLGSLRSAVLNIEAVQVTLSDQILERASRKPWARTLRSGTHLHEQEKQETCGSVMSSDTQCLRALRHNHRHHLTFQPSPSSQHHHHHQVRKLAFC